MPTVLTKQDSGVQMAHPGRAPVVLGSALNNKLIFEKRVPLDRLVTGNGTMSIRGFCHTPQCGRIIRGRADAEKNLRARPHGRAHEARLVAARFQRSELQHPPILSSDFSLASRKPDRTFETDRPTRGEQTELIELASAAMCGRRFDPERTQARRLTARTCLPQKNT
jgi:hypothetical protein